MLLTVKVIEEGRIPCQIHGKGRIQAEVQRCQGLQFLKIKVILEKGKLLRRKIWKEVNRSQLKELRLRHNLHGAWMGEGLKRHWWGDDLSRHGRSWGLNRQWGRGGLRRLRGKVGGIETLQN